jgi:YwiC-like protein
MSETGELVSAMQQARRRAMIVPREHGAWGLLLVPLFTGVAVGFAPEHRVWPLLLFTVAVLALFALRTPVESLLDLSPMSVRSAQERRIAVIGSVLFAAVASVCLSVLLLKGRYAALLAFGVVSACALVMQVVLRKLQARMTSQIAGAIALTCTAPAAYYIATGRLDAPAFALWGANWVFAGNQIHFVQLRIHAARVTTFAEKFERGKIFLLAQPVLLTALAFGTRWHIVPALATLAFLPAVVRGARWFFQKAEPLDVKKLGWSEMRQGLAFGFLLALAFLY